MKPENHSITRITTDYFDLINKPYREIPSIHFCDNKADANDCLALVLKGEKRATATAIYEFKILNEVMPKVGDLYVVTDWDGVGHCIIKTTKITVLPFREINQHHAYLEGEGDKSLEYWRRVHKAYYTRQFEATEYQADENMEIVFEEFKLVFKARQQV